MSDILCPKCGKSNPEGAETCAFCHEQLKSDLEDWFSFLEETDLHEEPPTQKIVIPKDEEPPDWLVGLREPGEMSSSPVPPALPEEGTPDWLGALADVVPEDKAPGISGMEDAETPDWLKDLGLGKTASNIEDNSPTSKTQGWLDSLQGDELSQEINDKPPQGEEEVEFPEWLSGLREEEQPLPVEATPGEVIAEEGIIPDWVNELQPENPLSPSQETTVKTEIPLAEESVMPEWLDGLRNEQTSLTTSEIPVTEASDETQMQDKISKLKSEESPSSAQELLEPIAEQAEMPVWLSSLREEQATSEVIEVPVSDKSDESQFPDWLSGLQTDEVPSTVQEIPATSTEEVAIPEWLSGLREDETPVATNVTLAPAATDEGQMSDQLGDVKTDEPPVLSQGIPAIPVQEVEIPGWLSELREEETPLEVIETPLRHIGEENQIPEWLSGGKEEETPLQEGETLPGNEETTLEWQSDLREESTSPEELMAVGNQSSMVEEILPEWLSSPGSEEIPQKAEESLPIAEEGDLPEWLSGVGAETPVSAPGGEPGVPEWLEPPQAVKEPQNQAVEQVEIPDWLSEEVREESPLPGGEEGYPESTGLIEGRLDWSSLEKAVDIPPIPKEPISQSLEETGIPDWLGSSREIAAEAAPEEIPVEAAEESNLPEWLSAPGKNELFSSVELDNIAPETPDAEIPNWLSEPEQPEELVDEKPQVGAEIEGHEGEGVEESSELPEWLQAMRPIEAVPFTGEEAGETVQPETSGPLIGLKGVLPVRELSSRHGIPPVVAAPLLISEKQAAHIALLEKVLVDESQPKLLYRERTQAPQFLVRVLVGLLLLVILSIPIILDLQLFDLPQDYPVWVPPFFDAVKDLPEDVPVLLAFEYEPGYASEMKLVGMPIIKHLMTKKVRLVILSTSFTGPALAEALLKESRVGDYSIDGKTINLGFLPGDATALKEFSLLPKDMTRYGFNTFYDGKEPWKQPQLTGIETVNDFSMVIVFTENFDKARNWLEQVQPSMDGTPLYFAASAQISPLLRPYISSGQVGGMVAGIADGMAYKQLINDPETTNGYWGSYQLGILFIIALIVVGAIIQLVLAPFWHKKTRKKGT